MSDNHPEFDFTIAHPISVWNRPLAFDSTGFFKSLGQAVVALLLGDVTGARSIALKGFPEISLQQQPAQAAWVLINRALAASLIELVMDYQDLFDVDVDQVEVAQAVVENHSLELAELVNGLTVGINQDFFCAPQSLALLEDIKPLLAQWLERLGLSTLQINAFHLRLKDQFVLALHNEWLEHPTHYQCIQDAVESPFVSPVQRQRQWLAYHAWLQTQTNARMFGEAFSLKQVYVPLRAYYKEKDKKTDYDDANATDTKVDDANIVCQAVDLMEEMRLWVATFDPVHAVRVLCGGPGSGKSSFSKMLAAEITCQFPEVSVLYVPLHHYDASDNLLEGIAQFIKSDRYLSDNPLDAKHGQSRLLLIFDGLDELSMQGNVAAETAQAFVEEVITKIERFNDQRHQRQVLITGRDIAIQAVAHRLRQPRQVLHVLPYYLSEEDIQSLNIQGSDGLLRADQRLLWWEKYCGVKQKPFTTLPEPLSVDNLIPITREPLLNYLVVLSYERDKIQFNNDTTLNAIYEDLLRAIYAREWEQGRQLQQVGALEEKDFFRILEEIALAIWHGDGRTATVEQIRRRCEQSHLLQHFEHFQEGAKQGVTRLLTAFYFRQSDHVRGGEKTFEFTHKSFGEYLTARRIVRLVDKIHVECTRYQRDSEDGYDKKTAMEKWIDVCGPMALDNYVADFVIKEIGCAPEKCAARQATFIQLIAYVVRAGSPMEKLPWRVFKDAMLQSRQAEAALLLIHHACANYTSQSIEVNWGTSAFDIWMQHVLAQSTPQKWTVAGWFSHLNLHSMQLQDINLAGVNLRYSMLSNTILHNADLRGADLRGVTFQGADLRGADFRGAILRDAIFRDADLRGADLQGAILQDAIFQGADLRGAILRDAFLQGAIFREAILRDTDLRDVNIDDANLRGVVLDMA